MVWPFKGSGGGVEDNALCKVSFPLLNHHWKSALLRAQGCSAASLGICSHWVLAGFSHQLAWMLGTDRTLIPPAEWGWTWTSAVFRLQGAAAAKLLQLCPTLCDPIDGSPPGSLVPGILQARTLEWVAISFSNAWKWKVKVKLLSRVLLLATPWTAAYQAPSSMGFSRQEYWSGVPLPSPDSKVVSNIPTISLLL